MQPFLALITPLGSGGHPDQGLPQPPLGIWGGAPPNYVDIGGPGPQPGPGRPTHPIYNPPYPSQGPGFPTHPIAPGGAPPGIWGGSGQPYPDAGFPGPQPGGPPGIWGGPWQPPHPSQGPGFPTNPIVLPPYEPGGPPVYISHPIAPGGERPTHPIVHPPLPPPPDGEAVKPPPEDGGWGYAPGAGWGYFPGTGAEAGPKKT